MIMHVLQPASEQEERSLTPLRLPAASGMLRGALVLHLPPRPRADVLTDLINDPQVNDSTIDNFVAELRTLGGMAVIA